jgi:predicted permease
MNLLTKFRQTLRSLWRTPAYTVTALVILALGIGATSAIFSVLYGVLLRPLPFPEPERIHLLSRQNPQGRSPSLAPPKAMWIHDHGRAWESVGFLDVVASGFNLTGRGEPQRLRGVRASAGLFDVLRIRPALGRLYTAAEDRPGTRRVALISHGLWLRQFGGDPAVLQQAVQLNGEPFEIVGVMPAGFRFHLDADLWTPHRAAFNPDDKANYVLAVARLRPGVSAQAASDEARSLSEAMRAQYPQTLATREWWQSISYGEYYTRDARPGILALAGAVGLLLLIACVNVANLTLARVASRQKDLAIRLALGASRGAVLGQVLLENLLVSVMAAGLGVALAFVALPRLIALAPEELPRLQEISMDAPVLVFAVLLAVLTGVLSALAPLPSLLRTPVTETLKQAGARGSAGWSTGRLRDALVVMEVALSVVLLIGAGLLIRSFAELRAVNTGFDEKRVLAFQTSLTRHQTPHSAWRFAEQALERLAGVPGVEQAATVSSLPLTGGVDMPFEVIGAAQPLKVDPQWRAVSADYFRVMRIPVSAGRAFTRRDDGASAPVAIVSKLFAERVFGQENPIGRRIKIPKELGERFADAPREIVGVVGDVHTESLEEKPGPTVYFPQAQVPAGVYELMRELLPLNWVLKTKGDPLALANSAKLAVQSVDPSLPLAEVRSMEQLLEDASSDRRFSMTLLSVFAGLALVLAGVGIYGVMAYHVLARTREFGIRMALGATAKNVVRHVLYRGLAVVGLGVVLGAAGAYGLTRFLSTLLFGVAPRDPATFLAVSGFLAVIALAAAGWPAWRASRIDPVIALRAE